MSHEATSALSATTLAMMLADARLPVGTHAYSAGLEPALVGGMAGTQVQQFMRGRATTVSLVDAGTAVVARNLALSIDQAAPDAFAEVEAAWAARTPSLAIRDAARHLGRGYVRLAVRLWRDHPAIIACGSASSPLSRPVILGAVAAAAGLDAHSLARLVVYDDAQTIASALLKLEPLDPTVPVAWVLSTCVAAEPYLQDLSRLTSPRAIPAFGAPQSEGWAEAHSHTKQRLFHG